MSTTFIPLAAIVDGNALVKIIVAAFAAGVGAVIAISLVIAGMTRVEAIRHKDGSGYGSGGSEVLSLAMVVLGGLILIAIFVIGFVAMTHKS